MKLVDTEYKEYFALSCWDQNEFAGGVTAAFLEINPVLASNVIRYDKVPEPRLV